MSNRQWSGRTDGTPWMQSSLIHIFKYVDVRFMYAVMAVVVVFYMLFNRQARSSQYDYFRHCMRYSRIRSIVHVYRNLYQFGQVVLDRFAAYAGRPYYFVHDGDEILNQVMSSQEGAIVVQTHIGNYELSGCCIDSRKPMHVLSYAGETDVVLDNRQRQLAEHNVHMIRLTDNLSHVFEVYNALQRGDMVSMPGDRIYGSDKTIAISLFGQEAHLPIGPFQTGVTMNVRMLTIWVMKERWNAYSVYIRELKQQCHLSRQQRILDLAQQFASQLESMARQYPDQWYHYYDFFAK